MAAPMKTTGHVDPNTDVEVSFEDQQKINKFARQNMRLQELQDELASRKKELQNLEDASDELLMADEDNDLIPYMIGEVYVNQSVEETQNMIETAKTTAQQDIDEIEKKSESIRTVLQDLKLQLYARFGTNINLEPEDAD